jgi:prophage regulatory protein
METETSIRLLKQSAVEDLTSLDRVTIWRRVRDGSFPRPLKISTNRVAWRESEVRAWVASLEAA